MKIQLKVLQLFSMLMISLTFSTSFPAVAIAQGGLMTATTRDAAADAKADTNKLAWFATGLGCGVLGVYGGGLIIDEYVYSTRPLYSKYNSAAVDQALAQLDEEVIGLALGVGTASYTASYIFSNVYAPLGPAGRARLSRARLTGKSSQYVEAYQDAYKEYKRKIQQSSTSWGWLTAAGVAVMYLLLTLD